MTSKHKESVETTALNPQPSIAVPATIVPPVGRGHEVMPEMDEMEIPRAKIVQFTSEEAKAKEKEDRVEPGTLINSITKQEIGKIFIPIMRSVNFIQWNPRKKEDPNFDPAFAPGALVFTTTNPRDPRVVDGIKFGPNGEAPKVTHYIDFLCYFPGEQYPLMLSFAKTSFQAGKRLNSLTMMMGGDLFSGKYKIGYTQEGESGSEHFVADIRPAGKSTPEEFAIAEHWYNQFQGKKLKVHSDEGMFTGEKQRATGEGFSN